MSIDRDSFFLVISMYIHLSMPIATFSHRIKDYRRGKTRGLYPGVQDLGEGAVVLDSWVWGPQPLGPRRAGSQVAWVPKPSSASRDIHLPA